MGTVLMTHMTHTQGMTQDGDNVINQRMTQDGDNVSYERRAAGISG